MKFFLILIFLIYSINGVAMERPKRHLVVFHKKGPKWPEKGLNFDDPIAQKHAKYYGKLFKEGVVLQGGPFPGQAGGMMIFKRGLSLEDVTKLAEADPAIKNGTMSFEIKTWMKVFGDSKYEY